MTIKEDQFNEVRVGPRTYTIPQDWEINQLDEIANVEYGKSLPESDGETPAVGSSGTYATVGDSLIQQDTIVIGRKGSAGESYFVQGGCWPSDTTFYLTDLDSKLVDIEYLHYYMRYNSLAEEIEQTTLPSLDRNRLETYRVLTPSLSDQRSIVDILSMVDKQIQQTDEMIKKTEELRMGLMTEFFHTGYYQYTTTTKGTLGEAPTDWGVSKLSDVAKVEMGSSPKSEYYNQDGDGLPFFQANNEFGYRIPTHDRWCSDPKKIAEKGDTLVTVRGTYVGQVNVAPERCCIGRGLAAVRALDVDQEYLYHQLAHRERYVKSIASGSTFDSINSNELRSLSVQVPPRDEQNKIASCLCNLQQKYIEETEHKKDLQELKRGLMQDLLTGKVRVDTD